MPNMFSKIKANLLPRKKPAPKTIVDDEKNSEGFIIFPSNRSTEQGGFNITPSSRPFGDNAVDSTPTNESLDLDHFPFPLQPTTTTSELDSEPWILIDTPSRDDDGMVFLYGHFSALNTNIYNSRIGDLELGAQAMMRQQWVAYNAFMSRLVDKERNMEDSKNAVDDKFDAEESKQLDREMEKWQAVGGGTKFGDEDAESVEESEDGNGAGAGDLELVTWYDGEVYDERRPA